MRCRHVNVPFFSVCSGSAFAGAGAGCLYRAGRALGGGTAMIVMNELVAGYERQPVTRPLSGTIERGSMTAIIGANGCGKSTLLKTLAGFIPPVSGGFRWQGKRPVIGWLAQRHALEAQFPLTVQDVVSMGCWPGISLFPGFVAKRGCALPARLSALGLSPWRYPPSMNSPAVSFSACCLPASWCSRRRW